MAYKQCHVQLYISVNKWGSKIELQNLGLLRFLQHSDRKF